MAYVGRVRIDDNTYSMPVGSTLFYTCSTGADTAVKTITTGTYDAMETLSDGITFQVLFTNTNTAANPTLKINSLVAFPILRNIGEPAGTTPETSWKAGTVVSLTYVNSVPGLLMNDSLNTDTKYGNATALNDGLMSKEDKAAMDATGVAIRNNCTASILSDSTYAGYPYKLAIYCDFGTEYANGFVHVIFTPEQIQAMKPATVATIDATGGIVTVPIKKQPNGDVTVPTVICWRTPNVRNIS